MLNRVSGTATIADGMVASLQVKSDALTWLQDERGISPATLARLDVRSGTAFFPETGDKRKAVFFNYAGGWKARSWPGKAFVSGPGFKRSFWNLERVLQA